MKNAIPEPSRRDAFPPAGLTRYRGAAAPFRCRATAAAGFGLLALVLAWNPRPVRAEKPDINPASVATLPPYCKHSMIYREKIPGANDPVEVKRWQSILGRGYPHIHHYCNGLLQTRSALSIAPSRQKHASLLRIALNEFDYVIRNVPESFVLLPEILTRRGENLIRLDRGVEAVATLEKAIEIKADYWPPYAYLSDYYKNKGDRDKARLVLEQGLTHAPGQDALTSRLSALNRTARAER